MKIKSALMFGALTISISFIFSTFAVITSQSIYQQAMAAAATSNNITPSAMSMTPVLGNPIFTEHDKITS